MKTAHNTKYRKDVIHHRTTIHLLVSSVVALYQDGRLNLFELLTGLLLFLVLVTSIETLNDLGRLIQAPLFLICTIRRQQVSTGLPAARSEISGPNLFRKFKDNFRTFLSVSRGSRHRKSSFLCAHKCYSLKQISIAVQKNVTKAMLHIKL